MSEKQVTILQQDDDEDMAAVGRAFMEAIEQARQSDPWVKTWAPIQCPSEIIFDLLNRQVDEESQAKEPEANTAGLRCGSGVQGSSRHVAGRTATTTSENLDVTSRERPAPNTFTAAQGALKSAVEQYFSVWHRCGGSETVSPEEFAAARSAMRMALAAQPPAAPVADQEAREIVADLRGTNLASQALTERAAEFIERVVGLAPAAPVETDDLVKRLRTKHVYGAFEIEQQRQDAANEIERLTADYNEMRAAHDKLVSRSSADSVDALAKTIWLAGFERAFSRVPTDPWENQADSVKAPHIYVARKVIEAGFGSVAPPQRGQES